MKPAITSDAPLRHLTTYRMGGPARFLIEAENEEDLLLTASLMEEAGLEEILVLGRGSNVLISDSGFGGIVVHLGPSFAWTEPSGDQMRAGGATPLPVLARESVRLGMVGLEFYVGIPGSVGGAIRMNAGGHGSDTASVLKEARVLDLVKGSAAVLSSDELDFGYRSSNLGSTNVVTEATFFVNPAAPGEAKSRMREIGRWRKENQPGGTLNAGSVFRNPEGRSAGRIIDELGLKGTSVGGASVSHKHANFFIAERGATSQDIYDLVGYIRAEVAARTGIELQPEIQFAGTFEDRA